MDLKIYVLNALSLYLIISHGLESVESNRVGDKIYQDLQNNYTCFRRMNATHQVGCSSDRSGNVGIIHILETEDDVSWLINSGPNSPYIAVIINPILFSTDVVLKLKQSGKINGILVAASKNITNDYPEGFSPWNSCPNSNFGMYTSEKNLKYSHCKQGDWISKSNPGYNLLFEDFGFPMSLISNESDLNSIRECFEKFNKAKDQTIENHAMCAAELSSRMSAAKDTKTCMRRSNLITNINPSVICDPLGDKNLYTFLHDVKSNSDRSVVAVIARLDSSSSFYGLTPGADSSVSGVVALLAVSEALTRVKQEFLSHTNNTNVIFILLNGEVYDYIGSSRMVYDMLKDKFDLKLSQISHIIQLDQLFSTEEQENYWMHTDPTLPISSEAQLKHMITTLLQNKLGSMSIEETDKARALPPASLQSFLTKDNSIPSFIISNFDGFFSNKFYGSIYDNADSIQYKSKKSSLSLRLANIATVVARTVFELATNETTNVTVDQDLIKDMLKCYLVSAKCDSFRKAVPVSLEKKLAPIPYNSYVGVKTITNELTVATSYLFHYLTGVATKLSEKECNSEDSNQRFVWITGPNLNDSGVCYQSSVKNHSAVSPAFEEEDWDSTEYSTWTESRWNSFSVRIFLKPSHYHEILTLVLGIIVFGVSLVFVYFVDKKSEILFGPNGSDTLAYGVPC